MNANSPGLGPKGVVRADTESGFSLDTHSSRPSSVQGPIALVQTPSHISPPGSQEAKTSCVFRPSEEHFDRIDPQGALSIFFSGLGADLGRKNGVPEGVRKVTDCVSMVDLHASALKWVLERGQSGKSAPKDAQ